MAARPERTTGFDYLRVGLALMIVVWHTCIICYGGVVQTSVATGWSRPIWASVLPMFFALSGFLVAGSLERSKTLISFLGLRIIRLLPALVVESILAVLLLGLVATTLPSRDYLHQHETWTYLRNIAGGLFGGIQYYLPGVFKSNPTKAVNLQLWTLPWELRSYICISSLVLIGCYKSKRLMFVLLFFAQVACTMHFFLQPTEDVGIVKGWALVMCFLYGVAFYRFRDVVTLRRIYGVLALIVTAVFLSNRLTSSLSPLPAAYLTVWLGLRRPRVIWPLTTGDYSYPIFLYGFPVQQAVAAALPWSRQPVLNLALTLLPLCLIAVVSWRWIELPVSAWARPILFRFEQRVTQTLSTLRTFHRPLDQNRKQGRLG